MIGALQRARHRMAAAGLILIALSVDRRGAGTAARLCPCREPRRLRSHRVRFRRWIRLEPFSRR